MGRKVLRREVGAGHSNPPFQGADKARPPLRAFVARLRWRTLGELSERRAAN